jgi:hypothetical protein
VLRKLPRLVVVVILITVVLALPRFAHHTPDSKHYINVAKYFQGDLPREQLLAPFAYRIFVPFLAATLPSDNLDLNFALINVLATILAYLVFIPYLKRFVTSQTDLNVGMLLLVVSFPSFNYASGVLSDPVAFLLFVVAAYLLSSERYYALSAVISLGVLARESLLTMTLASIMYVCWSHVGQGEKGWRKASRVVPLVTIPPAVVLIIVRACFSDLPSAFHWGVSLQRYVRTMRDPVNWATFLLTLGPPSILSLMGLRHRGRRPFESLTDRGERQLLSIAAATVINILIPVAGISTAYISGRFVWPFYIALIPIAVLSSSQTWVVTRWVGPIANRILGG